MNTSIPTETPLTAPRTALPRVVWVGFAGLGVTKLLQSCDGILEAVRPFEAVFVARGRPADFLARFTAMRDG